MPDRGREAGRTVRVIESEIKGEQNRLFETPRMFYPPEGLCRAEPERGPIVFTLHFIGVGRGTGGFKFCGGERPF